MYCTYTETLLHEKLPHQEVAVWDSIAVRYQPGRPMVPFRLFTLECTVPISATKKVIFIQGAFLSRATVSDVASLASHACVFQVVGRKTRWSTIDSVEVCHLWPT